MAELRRGDITNFNGGNDVKVLGPYDCNNAITNGDLVQLNTDGKVQRCATNATAALGWAMNSTTTDEDDVYVAWGGSAMCVMDVIAGQTIAITDYGIHYEIIGTTSVQTFDKSATTSVLLSTVEIDVTNALCNAYIIPSALQPGIINTVSPA